MTTSAKELHKKYNKRTIDQFIRDCRQSGGIEQAPASFGSTVFAFSGGVARANADIYSLNLTFEAYEKDKIYGPWHREGGLPSHISWRGDGTLLSVKFHFDGLLHRDPQEGPASITYRSDGSVEDEEYWYNGIRCEPPAQEEKPESFFAVYERETKQAEHSEEWWQTWAEELEADVQRRHRSFPWGVCLGCWCETEKKDGVYKHTIGLYWKPVLVIGEGI